MAEVAYVLEVITRSLNHYYPLRNFPVRIGRALDNDIILSDPTVSPYHLEIDLSADGELLLKNLSVENGTKLNRRALKESVTPISLGDQPQSLMLGTRRTQLLRADMPVAKTYVRKCSGILAVFCQPLWSVGLLLLTLLAFLFEAYLQTMYDKEPAYYLSSVLPYLLGMFALTLLVAGISRLSIQRWEVAASLSLSTLFLLGPYLLNELGHFLNYLLTQTWPLEWLVIISNFLLLPALLFIYLRIVHHAERAAAFGVAMLLSSPMLIYHASEFADRMTIANEFTGEAEFSRELSSLDLRLSPTLSIDKYIDTIHREFADKGQ